MAAIDFLTHELRRQSPAGFRVGREIAVRLSEQTVLEPDVLVLFGDRSGDPDGVIFEAADVLLAVEVESRLGRAVPRHQTGQVRRCRGIEHYWRVTQEDGSVPVVHTYRRGAEGDTFAPGLTMINFW